MNTQLSLAGWRANSALLLKAYLIAFVIVGCTPRPSELPVEDARRLGTRTLRGSREKVTKAAVAVLQDKHYSIELLDSSLGLITATKRSEKAQARIAEEDETPFTEEGLSEWQTFCLVSGILVGLAVFFSWLFDGPFDWGDDNDDVEVYPTVINPIWGDDDSPTGADYFEYAVTLNLEELSRNRTQVRLTINGSRYEDGLVQETGPVQTSAVYQSFFRDLENALASGSP